LAVTLCNPCHSLLPISLVKFVVLLRLDKLSLVLHSSVALFLDSSFISCHPPLLASKELVGVWLREGGEELKRLLLNLRKQLLLLLKEDCVHVVDSNSVVLCYA
jgi:hypothetical protein